MANLKEKQKFPWVNQKYSLTKIQKPGEFVVKYQEDYDKE